MTLADNRLELLPRIGYVSDLLFYSQEMTGLETQKFTRRYYPKWDNRIFEYWARNFNVHLKKKIKLLSQGTKTKLALALAIAKQPDIFILDEPTSGLDPIVRGEMLQALKQVASEREVIIMFSTHILEDIIEIVDKVIAIREGELSLVYDIKDREDHQTVIQTVINAIQ